LRECQVHIWPIVRIGESLLPDSAFSAVDRSLHGSSVFDGVSDFTQVKSHYLLLLRSQPQCPSSLGIGETVVARHRDFLLTTKKEDCNDHSDRYHVKQIPVVAPVCAARQTVSNPTRPRRAYSGHTQSIQTAAFQSHAVTLASPHARAHATNRRKAVQESLNT
jgi:hypothetical protein